MFFFWIFLIFRHNPRSRKQAQDPGGVPSADPPHGQLWQERVTAPSLCKKTQNDMNVKFRMNDAKVLIPHKRKLFNRKFLSLGNFYKIWFFRSYAQVSLNSTSLTWLRANYIPWCVSFKDLAARVIEVKTTNCTVRMFRTHSHKGISPLKEGTEKVLSSC